MKSFYSFVVVLLFGAASLTSCSRTNYAFNNKVPAHLGSEQAVIVATQPFTAPEIDVKTEKLPVSGSQAIAPAAQLPASSVAAKALVSRPAKATHQSLVQRLLVKQVAKQFNKVAARSQNTAHVEHTASKAGQAGLVILAGLIILLIGGLIGGLNFVATIGGVVFLVGLILLIVALVRA